MKVPTRDPGEGAVVGAAAAAEPLAGGGDRQPGDEDDVGGGDGFRPEPAAHRLEQAAAGGRERGLAVVDSAQSRSLSGSSTGRITRLPAEVSRSRSAVVPGSVPTET